MREQGNIRGAVELCQEMLSRDPQQVDAHYLLGMLFGQGGDLDRAIPHLQRAIALAPYLTVAHIALGNVSKLQGNGAAAEASYRNALAIDPDSPAANYNLGLVLKHRGEFDAALKHFDHACAANSAHDEAIQERGRCLIQLARYDEAVSFLLEATARRPENASLQACLGVAWQEMLRPQEALACYERARQLGHVDAELFKNLGIVLQELGRMEEALEAYQRAVELQPDHAVARFHRALGHLLIGDYAGAWPDYEVRLASIDRPPPPGLFPRWDNQSLAGRSILVHGEQGIGDEIMFASCLPQVIERAGRCVISCFPKLETLFRRSFPGADVYAAADTLHTVSTKISSLAIDFEIPIGSLPLALRRSRDDFPAHRGYLKADPERVDYWQRRLSDLGTGPKIGISWQGGTHKTKGPLRSIPLIQWLPILRTSRTRFVSLQYSGAGAALAELKRDHGIDVAHWQDGIDDYDETAALMCALDLTISVCTSIVDLGGALGRPVWVMAPLSPDWRYGIVGETMPWYPSVRVFRQPEFGAWTPVINRVAAILGERTQSRQSATDS